MHTRINQCFLTYLNGDADGDGRITVIDATLVQRVVADKYKDTDGTVTIRGDVDKNGLRITDATAIQRYVAQFNDPYQINTKMNAVKRGDNELPEIEA